MGLNPGAISFVRVDVSLAPEILRALLTSYSALTATSALIVVLLLRRSWRRGHPALLAAFAGGAVIGAVVLVVAVESTTFLIDAEVIAQANAIGLPYTPSSQDHNLSQALRPAMVVLVLLATALVVGYVQRRTVATRWLASACIVLVVSTLPLTLVVADYPFGPRPTTRRRLPVHTVTHLAQARCSRDRRCAQTRTPRRADPSSELCPLFRARDHPRGGRPRREWRRWGLRPCSVPT